MLIGGGLDDQRQALAVEFGVAAIFVRNDVTSEADCAHVVEAARNIGKLHGLASNAGITQHGYRDRGESA